MLKHLLLFGLTCLSHLLIGQSADLHGTVKADGATVEFASIQLEGTAFGAVTNTRGKFHLHQVPFGSYTVIVSYIGYEPVSKDITLSQENRNLDLSFDLVVQNMQLDEIVVTGTKTFKRLTNSPVIVNVVNSQTLDNIQACNLSEGLRFQPGLRVETDCQTCNYTQLRMNGLAGGYSQILVNGRPIFSPLTGLYGLEQLPTNMIDRIEVIRGGGSSLYGSNAIGGTVNVITKIPNSNSYALNYNFQNIDGQTSDHQLMANATLVSKNSNSGISMFANHRDRGFYDANADSFSEIPLIENTSFGANVFLLPTDNQKIELSFSNLNEYRFGGEMNLDIPAYQTEQAEERQTDVWMGSADYQINFNNGNSSLITYLAGQTTKRTHYTGIIPDGGATLEDHLINPPYGASEVNTFNAGIQINHRLNNFLNGINVLTFGTEYMFDEVRDEIPAYRYFIDQTTKDFGVFVQSDWEITPSLTLLSGARLDQHNLVDQAVISPRASLLYKYKNNTQLRLSYGAGFRAPQAFDADLHIAFAGGGVSRVSLSPNLIPEKSHSYSASINYDRPTEKFIVGFTLEGFYTRLNNAFVLQPIGEDTFGERFEKQNGQGATVQGGTLELRANYNRKIQLETGITLQKSEFDDPVQYIEGLEGIRSFTRTPNDYGFALLTYTPNKSINANINYVYTGSMEVPHFSGAPNQDVDEIITSPAFSELNLKLGYTFRSDKKGANIELYGGVRNLLNQYQDDFDIGKNRDSNFVYGPAQPKTFYLGVKLFSN